MIMTTKRGAELAMPRFTSQIFGIIDFNTIEQKVPLACSVSSEGDALRNNMRNKVLLGGSRQQRGQMLRITQNNVNRHDNYSTSQR
jgi:hypothetical protein